MNDDPAPEIFISYSHSDSDYAHKLANALEGRGFTVFIDDRIDYGSQWPVVLQEKLDACLALVLLMTPRSFQSDWVQNELSRAKRKRKGIFPLLLEGDEPWLSVEATLYVDVRGGLLPPQAFFDRLRKFIPIDAWSAQPPSEEKVDPFAPIPLLAEDSIKEAARIFSKVPAQEKLLADVLVGDWEVKIETKRSGSGRLGYMVLSLQRNGDFNGEWREEPHQHWSKQRFVLQGEWRTPDEVSLELKGDRIDEFRASDYKEVFKLRRETDDDLRGENTLGESVRWERLPEGFIENLL